MARRRSNDYPPELPQSGERRFTVNNAGNSSQVQRQPIPVFYEGKMIGWKLPNEEAIFPATAYRPGRLFSKI